MADRAARLRALEPHTKDRGAHAALLTLEAIEALTLAEGFSPTIRDVARVRELTLPGVQHHIKVLEFSGLLQKRVKGNARAFKVLDPSKKEEKWAEACTRRFTRGETRTHMDIRNAVMAAVEDTLFRVDLEGSQIELVIRHRP